MVSQIETFVQNCFTKIDMPNATTLFVKKTLTNANSGSVRIYRKDCKFLTKVVCDTKCRS